MKTAITLVGMMLLLAVSAAASPGTGECKQATKAAAIAALSPVEGTLGDAVSDGFFGNEPNLLNTNTNDDLGPEQVAPGSSAGFVEGSLSPGPKTIGGGFTTLGSVMSATANDCS